MKYGTKGSGKTRHHVTAWDSSQKAGSAACGTAVDGEIIFVETADFLSDPAGCKKCKAWTLAG